MMKSPIDVLAEAITASLPEFAKRKMAATIIAALRESGWIIVRHDAIRLAQAHARADK